MDDLNQLGTIGLSLDESEKLRKHVSAKALFDHYFIRDDKDTKETVQFKHQSDTNHLRKGECTI